MTTIESPTVPETQQGSNQKKRNRTHSRPVFTRKLTLSSSQAQRVMERSFAPTAHALFSIDVILRIIAQNNPSQANIDEVESVVVGMIDAVSTDMDIGLAQFEKLMADNGIELDNLPKYDAPNSSEVEITSPQISHFISLVIRLDKLISYIDTLWLNSVLNNKQRTDATYQWQQRLIRLAGRIIGLEKRARISAHAKGKSDEVSELAPEQPTTDVDLLAEANVDLNEPEVAEDKTSKKSKKAA